MEAALPLTSLSRAGLRAFLAPVGPSFRADQVWRWLYNKGVREFDAMTNVPASVRDFLKENTTLSPPRVVREQRATDGTLKWLVERVTGQRYETVLIPDFEDDGTPRRMTVCVSSQVGCALGCSFCATGQMGFKENLTSGEIFDQVWLAADRARTEYEAALTNIVFMGMGEPLLNYDAVTDAIDKITSEDGLGMGARRITVSTVGLAKQIRRLADDGFRSNLAVSLHAPIDAKRSSIMPVNRNERTDLESLLQSIEYYCRTTGRGVTYEYCMFAGFNDTLEDATALADLVDRAPSKVNLIMYNAVDGLGFTRTSDADLNAFIARLVERRVTVTVRRSRGQDIAAACGQLASES
ncbi:MAG: 23S rRNA (adenine(2503)-C(2))-methyltransferase RlmN [Rhodothermales bacterium]